MSERVSLSVFTRFSCPHSSTRARSHTHTHTRTHTHTCHRQTRTCMSVCVRIHKPACVQTHSCVHMTHSCVLLAYISHTRAYICRPVCTCTFFCMHMHIFIYTHAHEYAHEHSEHTRYQPEEAGPGSAGDHPLASKKHTQQTSALCNSGHARTGPHRRPGVQGLIQVCRRARADTGVRAALAAARLGRRSTAQLHTRPSHSIPHLVPHIPHI